MLILLVGLTSSGKSTAAEILREMGFSVASTGDVIREEIRNRGLEYDKKNDLEVSKWFNEGREELVVRRLLHMLSGKRMALDGIRSPEMLEKLEETAGERPVIVAIKADFDSRFRRECERKKFVGFTREDMRKRDNTHLGMGTRELMEKADFTIDNTNLTKEELRRELKGIVESTNI